MKLNTLFFAATALILIIFSGCSKQPGVWKNSEIETGLREDFHETNNIVIKLFKEKNMRDLDNYLAKELIGQVSVKRDAERLGNTLKGAEYSLLDEYYTVNKYRDFDTIKTEKKGIENYVLQYQGFAKEMYIAFFTPKTGDEKKLITLVFAKLDYGWKICQIDTAPYTFDGKNAPQLYEQAKAQYKKGQLINAKLTMDLAMTASKPSGIWQYTFDEDMRFFSQQLNDEAMLKYSFPWVINQIATKPKIFSIFVRNSQLGTYPVIQYITTIPLTNKQQIIDENNLLKAVISDIMPGVNKDNKYITYAAFNRMTRHDYAVDRYEIIDTLK